MKAAPALWLCGFLCVGCGSGGETTVSPSTPPPTIHLMPGMAMMQGRVLDIDGQPIAGSVVTVAETEAQASTDTEGRWQLVVPGDTTVSLRADAPMFARTLAPAVMAASGGTVEDLDLSLVPLATIDTVNGLSGKNSDAAGVISVRLRSASAGCAPDGGRLDLTPDVFGHVVYARGGPGAIADPSLQGVQPGAAVAAWISGVVPPAAYDRLLFVKEGCRQKAPPISDGGLTYMGMAHVEPGSLSQLVLFLE